MSADKPEGTVPLRLLDWRLSVNSAEREPVVIHAGGITPVRLLKERSRTARSVREVQEGGRGPERALRETLRERSLLRRATEASGRVCVHRRVENSYDKVQLSLEGHARRKSFIHSNTALPILLTFSPHPADLLPLSLPRPRSCLTGPDTAGTSAPPRLPALPQ